MPPEIRMGNCLRLGISRVGLAWSKWRIAAKFKKKNVSIIILGMQAVGKSTIALRLYKFKRALPDTNYVQTKGFNTFTVKKNKTTVNIYDLGGHPSIQELWDHYYADAHGVIFVVDSSKRESVPEAGNLLSTVLSDNRISGKPVLLLANKIDLGGISEAELDTMLNLQQLVNSVRCLTRLDVSCATDLKNDKGIFDGFKWLISYIESNYYDINSRVLSDVMVEKNREKARREAVKAARLEAAEKEDETNCANGVTPNSSPAPIATSTPIPDTQEDEADGAAVASEALSVDQEQNVTDNLPSEVPSSNPNPSEETTIKESFTPPPTNLSRQIEMKPIPAESVPLQRIPLPLLPPTHSAVTDLSEDKPVKLPRLKSPKSRPEKLSRIEDTGGINAGQMHEYSGTFLSTGPDGDEQYRKKGFRFKNYSSANRPSPEGADSDDGVVNMAYEPTEDLSSDSTPIGVRKHNFNGELQNKEIFMITTLAEVHKEYLKERKSSTSTHDSVSMSMESCISDLTDPMQTGLDETDSKKSSFQMMYQNTHHHNADMLNFQRTTTGTESPLSNKVAIPISKGKSKKRLSNLKHKNKTAPMPAETMDPANASTLMRSVASPIDVAALENKFSANKSSYQEKFHAHVPNKALESSNARSGGTSNSWMDNTEENGNS